MTIDADELRDQASELEQVGTCKARDAAYLRESADGIDRLRAERDWYKNSLSVIAAGHGEAQTIAQQTLEDAPGGDDGE